jgi:hypothetical protein
MGPNDASTSNCCARATPVAAKSPNANVTARVAAATRRRLPLDSASVVDDSRMSTSVCVLSLARLMTSVQGIQEFQRTRYRGLHPQR